MTDIELVIFDCDGVLIDSEAVANAVLVREAAAIGWRLTEADAYERFLGMQMEDVVLGFEHDTGRAAPPAWRRHLADRLIAALAEEAVTIPGAHEALDAVRSLGLAVRVASNSSQAEMAVKFQRTGLADRLAGRCHGVDDVPRGKPAPDVYLAAARAEGVAPAHCLVVEDSRPGIRAGVAAGMTVIALAPTGSGHELLALGASAIIRSLAELGPLLAAKVQAGPAS